MRVWMLFSPHLLIVHIIIVSHDVPACLPSRVKYQFLRKHFREEVTKSLTRSERIELVFITRNISVAE